MAFPDGWTKRCPIVIDADQVDELLTDWPMLLTEANLPAEIFTGANADGSDIRASSDEAGTSELAVQVVSFDPGGTAQIWIKIPSVSAVADTTIYLWFGNPAATMPAADSAFGSQAVWSNNFVGVYHLEEIGDGTAGEYKDSTANANHGQGGDGTASAVPSQIAGQWGHAQRFSGGFGGDYIGCGIPAIDGVTEISFQAWVRPTAMPQPVEYVGIAISRGSKLHGLSTGSGAIPATLWANSVNKFFAAGVNFSVGSWTNLAGVLGWNATGGKAITYWDGAVHGTASDGLTSAISGSGVLKIGYDTAIATRRWAGDIDEVRLSSAARSAAWIKADHISQSSPGTFAAAGAVENVGAASVAAAHYYYRHLMGVSA